jgi:iron(III) transport system substrate-binding protein
MGERERGLFTGWDYVERLAGQLGRDGVSPASSAVYRAVASGDFYAGITYENYVLSLRKTGSSIGYCYPQEGTSAVPDGIALMKNARNRAEAGQFIDFVLSRDVQSLLLPRWQRRPVRIDAGVTDEPLPDIPFIHYPVAAAAAERDAILARWASLYAPYRP